MSKVLVRWNKSHVMSVQTGMPDASVVQFIPGVNEFTKEQWELVSKHPELKKRMETDVVDMKRGKVKMLEVLSAEKKSEGSSDSDSEGESNDEGSSEEGIAGLSAGDAKALVEETFNTPLLKSWLESETRKTVKSAIEKQLETIEKERQENGDDENDSQE